MDIRQTSRNTASLGFQSIYGRVMVRKSRLCRTDMGTSGFTSKTTQLQLSWKTSKNITTHVTL